MPKRRGEQALADPNGLPRQRRGTTPQLHGRYPDYDVLEQAEHWDEVTRKVVLDRVHEVPPIRFFAAHEVPTLEAFCDTALAQDCEPRIPVLSYVDEKLYSGNGDGYQYYDMPDDGETWRLVAGGRDEEAQRRGAGAFAEADEDLRVAIVHDFSHGDLHGGVWDDLNVSRAWSIVMRYCLQAFYAHPWAWNEIGFGGPAYPRGYARFGSPHLEGGDREEWEAPPAVTTDPVSDVRVRGLD
ncbi:MAG: gluconate 2-dehydrogenase subunit 3 family protein [Actinobacteria bacterium]|nr:gluconate 2-dehydrogenase subunit 3 family protein [Actinomycetota bacterium]